MTNPTDQTWSEDPYAFDPNDQRFERKFTTEAMSASDLDVTLRVHPSGFVVAYPDRWINNIYLDTDNLSCYRDHIYGSRSRMKFRIRWYGDLLQPQAKPVLEIKRKVGMVGSKLRFDLPQFDSSEHPYNDGLLSLVREADIDPRIKGRAEAMKCVVGNRYRRNYFVTADGDFRMTVDRELQFFEIPTRPNNLSSPIHDNTVVLELKYQNELDAEVEKVTRNLPFRTNRMSKYILGIDHLAASGRL